MVPILRRAPLWAVALSLLLLGPALLAPRAEANQTLRFQVADGSDDAEEGNDGPGVMDVESSDLEIADDDEGIHQTIGVRFRGVAIPQGTPILSAHIQLATDEPDKNRDPFSVTVYGEAADNAAPYTAADYDIGKRVRTSAEVDWADIPAWTTEHESGPDQRTPDLKALVQEIVNRPGWQSGNAMAFLIEGSGTRSAESYEGSIGDTEVADFAPELVVVVPSTETYRVAASDDDAEEGDDGPGAMDIDSSDLELVEDHPGTPQTVGVRLRDVRIPKGAQILSAYLQFAVDEGDRNADPFDVTVWGEAADHPAPYVNQDYNVSSRAKTAASVSWSAIPAWTVPEEEQPGGIHQRTPDLKAIVQELVDRAGWAEGNAMAFILQGTGQRVAESFDGDSARAPALVVDFIGEQSVPNSSRVRLSWAAGDDPTTQMTVIWDQMSGTNPRVLYDLYDPLQGCTTDPAEYADSRTPTRIDPYRGMNNHFARLSGLAPDTAYRFVIADDTAVGECMWFRTAPSTPVPFTYITGGDTKSAGDPLQAGRWSNRMVAKLRPLFVFFTGDYNSGDGTDDASWKQWLTDWFEGTRSADGRMYPIVAVHGNHEDGDLEMLYRLFGAGNTDPDQAAEYDYYSLTLGGGLLHVIALNSQLYLNGKQAAHDRQTAWLDADLAANAAATFKVAGYHKPIRPHTSSKAENDHELAWADLFDLHGLTIAYESDTHNHKITFPLRRSDAPGNDMGFVRDDDNGVLYVGEGSWGATPRVNDDDKSWTLDSASLNQIKWAHVYPATDTEEARLEIRTVVTARYENGKLVNYVDGVGEVGDADPFAIPEGIELLSAPFYGEVISIPFEALSGEPPAAPTTLTGQALSYTEIALSWTNTEDPANVASITVDRRIAADGEWKTVASSLPGDTESFVQTELADGTDYWYRVRANNVFGSSDWSNEVLVSTPADTRARAVFVEGTDGYDGTFTIAIAHNSPDGTFVAEELSFDQGTSDYGPPDAPAHGLIRFDGLFGPGGIPAGAVVTEATLRFWTTSSSTGPVGLHRMLAPWDGASTWNSLGDGVQADGVEAIAEPDSSRSGIQGGAYVTFDVTSSVNAWAAGADNRGWLILNRSTDGWDVWTELYDGDDAADRRPRLTVFYALQGDADGDGVPDGQDACPSSQLTAQVVMTPCDCGVANDVMADGCSVSDVMLPLAQAPGVPLSRRMSQVQSLGFELQKEGVLTHQEVRALVSCVQASAMGRCWSYAE